MSIWKIRSGGGEYLGSAEALCAKTALKLFLYDQGISVDRLADMPSEDLYNRTCRILHEGAAYVVGPAAPRSGVRGEQ